MNILAAAYCSGISLQHLLFLGARAWAQGPWDPGRARAPEGEDDDDGGGRISWPPPAPIPSRPGIQYPVRAYPSLRHNNKIKHVFLFIDT